MRILDHPLVAAPFFLMTSLHVFRKDLNVFWAALLAFAERSKRRTRSLRTVFCTAGRPARKSARSMPRNHRRTWAQNFSTGFRSGDRGGIWHSETCSRRCACRLGGAFRNVSLSHMMRQGPSPWSGCAARHAAMSIPLLTARTRRATRKHFEPRWPLEPRWLRIAW